MPKRELDKPKYEIVGELERMDRDEMVMARRCLRPDFVTHVVWAASLFRKMTRYLTARTGSLLRRHPKKSRKWP